MTDLKFSTNQFVGEASRPYLGVFEHIVSHLTRGTVIEMGAGAGLLGIHLLHSRLCDRLILVDVIPECVNLCKLNLAANDFNLLDGEVYQSDVFETVPDYIKGELVIFMPPANNLPVERIGSNVNYLRFIDPESRTTKKFLIEVRDRLTPKGHALMTVFRPSPEPYPWWDWIHRSGLVIRDLILLEPHGAISHSGYVPSLITQIETPGCWSLLVLGKTEIPIPVHTDAPRT
jgi:hypothetical protein